MVFGRLLKISYYNSKQKRAYLKAQINYKNFRDAYY